MAIGAVQWQRYFASWGGESSVTIHAASAAAEDWLWHRAARWQPSIASLFRHRHRSAHRPIVLPVAVDPIGHPVVHVHVIHLTVRERHPHVALLRVDARAAVIGQDVP